MRPPAPPRALRLLVVAALALVAAATAAGCGDSHDYYSVEQLMDATNCMECHPQHYQEWSGSMHAYAADDPVFLAMNKRGQEETNGELGDFCVNCHAPMAVRLGLTTDGLNLDEVPQYAKGVTCYFCHSVESVGESHNNDITLATDGIMRGGLSNPVASPKHAMMTSPLVDADNQASSAMCGACHDVVTPAGVHLERTFEEWNDSIFASTDPATHLSCGQCHMKSRTDVAAEVPGLDVPLRQNGVRDHKFAGVDVALTPWPEKEAQLEAIQGDLDPSLLPRLCVVPLEGGRIDYRLDDVGPGHMWPSGAAHDRRAWAEVIAYDADDNVLMQTGVVLDGEDPDPVADPWIWEMRDYVYDADGTPVKYFWEVRQTLTGLLPPSVTRDPSDPRFDHSVTRSWHVNEVFQDIARVTARVFIRPLPFEVLDDLMASGHLTVDVRDQLPTFELAGTELEWRPELADLGGCVR